MASRSVDRHLAAVGAGLLHLEAAGETHGDHTDHLLHLAGHGDHLHPVAAGVGHGDRTGDPAGPHHLAADGIGEGLLLYLSATLPLEYVHTLTSLFPRGMSSWVASPLLFVARALINAGARCSASFVWVRTQNKGDDLWQATDKLLTSSYSGRGKRLS